MTEKSWPLRWETLLILLLAAFIIEPIFGNATWVNLLGLALVEIVVVAAIIKSLNKTRDRGVGLFVVVAWFGTTILALLTDDAHGVVAAVSGVMLIGALFVTFRNLLEREAGDYDALVGAIFGYVLLATVWAMFYVQIERWHPGSIGFGDSADLWTSSIYFSLVTLTSLGYGDILPLSPLARITAGLEAVGGVLYMAIMIGSIVGTYRQKPTKKIE
ncbi:potassium channel family protein [Shimia abyssi]|uniref:Ion channel n=1 Tax=Shimia abyssi TaxID=1662395 RepID=A0A2P8FEC1_9RHOB|nr:potassium channel family protein [Shimia abyssi]PSL20069.1 ion channel [Shimia abyssi]